MHAARLLVACPEPVAVLPLVHQVLLAFVFAAESWTRWWLMAIESPSFPRCMADDVTAHCRRHHPLYVLALLPSGSHLILHVQPVCCRSNGGLAKAAGGMGGCTRPAARRPRQVASKQVLVAASKSPSCRMRAPATWSARKPMLRSFLYLRQPSTAQQTGWETTGSLQRVQDAVCVCVHMHEGELHPSSIDQAKLGQSASTTPRTYLVCIVAVVRTRYGEGHGHLVPAVPHTRVPPQQHVIRILWPLHSRCRHERGQ